MATVGVKAMALYNEDEKESGLVQVGYEAASQSFKKGDFLGLDTAGRVDISVDTESGMFALALEDATGTTDNPVDILVLNYGTLLTASISAAGAAAVTARTNVGLKCSWIRSTQTGETGKNVVDTSDTTTPSLEIIGLDLRDALGDTNGRVIVRVTDSFIIGRAA